MVLVLILDLVLFTSLQHVPKQIECCFDSNAGTEALRHLFSPCNRTCATIHRPFRIVQKLDEAIRTRSISTCWPDRRWQNVITATGKFTFACKGFL